MNIIRQTFTPYLQLMVMDRNCYFRDEYRSLIEAGTA